MEIFNAISNIIFDVEAIEKNHKNELQKYKFRGIDDVLNALNPLFAKHKVILVPKYSILHNEAMQGKNKQGEDKITFRVIVQGEYKLMTVDGSFVEVTTIGEALDTSDKAFNKAMSAALKYAMFQTFIIPTEEDKDTENHHIEVTKGDTKETINESQIKRLWAISKGKTDKINAEAVKTILKKYGYERTESILQSKYNSIIEELKVAVLNE